VPEYHLVAHYKFKKRKGGYSTARLYCGNSAWGFRHIAAGDKGKRISNYPPDGWGAFNYSLTYTEKAWSSYKYRSSNDTYAYSPAVYILPRW